MYTPENIELSNLMIFLQCAIVLGIIIIIFLLAALVRRRTLTVDDSTGEKKQKIYDTLIKVRKDLETTV